jgi:ubiquinol-cytochrome c reductase iron-sulfur subunit
LLPLARFSEFSTKIRFPKEKIIVSEGANQSRRRFLVASTSVVGAAGAVGAAVPFVGSWNPSAKALAAGAPITVDISRLETGMLLGPMPAWRGQPIFIMKRDETILENLHNNIDHLADPTSENKPEQQPTYALNEYRARKPEIMVLVGLCTHLGCSPQVNAEVGPQDYDPEWTGGFFCPCHGSKFDLAGRVYKGVPAPSNLEVPPHFYVNDDVIVVGQDEENS